MISLEQFYRNLQSNFYEDNLQQYAIDSRVTAYHSRQEHREMMTLVSGIVKHYRYLITFTKDKKKKLPENQIIEKYIEKQIKRKPLKVVCAYIVREGDDISTHVHWHVVCETLKPLKKDRFNYYIKKFGNIDISRTKAQNIEEGINYITKENEPREIEL